MLCGHYYAILTPRDGMHGCFVQSHLSLAGTMLLPLFSFLWFWCGLAPRQVYARFAGRKWSSSSAHSSFSECLTFCLGSWKLGQVHIRGPLWWSLSYRSPTSLRLDEMRQRCNFQSFPVFPHLRPSFFLIYQLCWHEACTRCRNNSFTLISELVPTVYVV